MSKHGDLGLMTAGEVLARRHPWAVLGVWGWQTALAIGASWPASSLVRASYGGPPRRDAPLWDPGAHALLDFLWHNTRAVAPVISAAEIVLIVGAVVGLLPMAAAMFTMTHAPRRPAVAGFVPSISGALRAMPSLLSLLVVVSIAQAATIAIGLVVGESIEAWTHSGLGDARAQRIGVAVGLVFLGAASGLGVVHDLARAAVVRSGASWLRALAFAARIFSRAPLPIGWSWAWRALLSLAPVFAVAAVASRAGGRGGMALWVLAALHQAVAISRVALRASWLASALRSVS